MKKIYAESWALFRRGTLVFTGLAVLIEAFFYVFSANSSSTGLAVGGLIMAFFAHRYFLKGEDIFSREAAFSKPNYDQKGMSKFIFVAMAFVVSAAGISVLIVIGAVNTQVDEGTWVGIAVFLTFVIYWIVLGLFGTVLPSIVDRDPRFRLKAGMARFRVMMWRLLLGPGLASVGQIAVGMALFILLAHFGLKNNFWAEHLLGVIGSYMGFFLIIIGAATLCSVYRMVVPEPSAE